MRKSLTINNYQASATGLATDPGRGRGGGAAFSSCYILYGLSPTEFFYKQGLGFFMIYPHPAPVGLEGAGRQFI